MQRRRVRIASAVLLAGVGLCISSARGADAPINVPGFLKFEVWNGLSTSDNSLDGTLLADARFPGTPDAVYYTTAFDSRPVYPNDSHEGYGGKMSGYITPLESGNYRFFIYSDDSSRLFLSADDKPTSVTSTPIAEETGCCNVFTEPDSPRTSEPVSLVAGKRYYLEMIWKEGNGGDYAQVAWRKEGDTTPAASLKPIPGAFLSTDIPAGGSVSITQQPTDVSAAQNDFATFSLEVTATPSPVNIQWQRNGVNVPGLTGRTIRLGPLAPSDSGAKYRAVVSVPGAVATSSEASVTVTADTTPPTILNVAGSDSLDSVTVDFSEAVTAASAGSPGNYSLDNGLTVTAATVLNPSRVRLTTGKQTPGTTYTLTIKDIVDTAGQRSAADTKKSFPAFELVRGGLKFEAFFDITSTSVDTLLDDPKYQANTPDQVGYVSQFTSRLLFADSSHENYGGRISGWLVPAETGQYEFFLRSDDASRLFLSSDDKPENAAMIAEETGCCGAFEEPGAPETSAPISLTAGRRYYIYALWKEGGGGDYCDVAWRKVGDTTSPRTLPYIPGTVLESYAAPGTFTPPEITITSPTAGSRFDPGAPVTLTANASAAAGKSVAKVEFFEATKKLGEATFAPYSIVITDLSTDVHSLTARVTDSAGLFKDSEPVSITVGAPVEKITLVAIDDKTTWRYDRSGQDLGATWREKAFNDSTWPEGKALIADETTTTVEPIRTAISRLTDAGDYIKTFYFRTHFDFSRPITPDVKLQLRHVVDDGAIFYLNGTEIVRFNIAEGDVDATTDASGHENAWEGPYDVPTSLLVQGDNVLAAEVHQSGGSSSDMVFGGELVASVPGSGPPPSSQSGFSLPVLQAGKLTIAWSGSATLQSAPSVAGPWADVPGAVSPLTLTSFSDGQRFYRLK